MPKTGLVISGGGTKGAFAVGVLEYLRKVKNIEFDLVIGTSTGALITPLLVTDEIDALKKIYCSVDTPTLLTKLDILDAYTKGYLFSSDGLSAIIQNAITLDRWNAIQASPKQMCVTGVGFQSGNTTYFHTGPSLNVPPGAVAYPITSGKTLMQAIAASANEPCFTPSIRIPETGGEQYWDGGVRDYVGITTALMNGVEELYVIILSPEANPYQAQDFNSLDQVLMRTIALLSDEVGDSNQRYANQIGGAVLYLNSLQQYLGSLPGADKARIAAAFQSVPDLDNPGGTLANPFSGFSLKKKPVIIRPDHSLADNSLEFGKGQMAGMIDIGYAKAQSVVV